jgi:cyclohexanone monooxygenase
VDTIIRLARLGQSFLEECTPGYYNNEGKPGERSGQNGFYGGGSVAFFQLLRDWRNAGELRGLELE